MPDASPDVLYKHGLHCGMKADPWCAICEAVIGAIAKVTPASQRCFVPMRMQSLPDPRQQRCPTGSLRPSSTGRTVAAETKVRLQRHSVETDPAG
jgi:hypothetical protein